jgi:hypothetical protein
MYSAMGKKCERGQEQMGSGSSRSIVFQQSDEVIARSFIQATADYQTEIEIGQNLRVHCTPSAVGGRPEDSDACVNCYLAVGERQVARYNYLKSRGSKPTESYAEEMANYATQLEACKTSCKACVISDVSQTQSFQWKSGAFNKSSVKTKFDSVLKTNVSQALDDNQDVLNSLAGVLGPSDRQNVKSYVANRISARINQDTLEEIYNRIKQVQNVTLSGSGIYEQGITQNAAISGLVDIISDKKISDTILTATEVINYQTIHNDENTVGALGESLRKAALSFGELFDSIVGKIMVLVVAAVLLAATGLSLYALVKDLTR